MTDVDMHYLSIAELGSRIKSKEISPVEVTRAYLDRIEAQNERIGAFVTVMADAAMTQARAAEREIQSGQYRGRMHGIPIAVKDIIYTKGVLTSAGSKVLADHVPNEDSTIVERLNAAGAVLLGKLNLSEFAIGGTIDHPYGTPRNPWNLDHTAGGSSSGSGVATAGGLCAGALGSDTGGSIRGPAGFCGLAGIRPTYGRVTRHNVVPMCWSLDTVGPMTRTVEDCAIMLQSIAGHDPRDATSSKAQVPDYVGALTGDVTGLKVALPREMFDFEALDSEVKEAVERAVGVLAELGASTNEVSLPTSERSGAVFIANADVDCAAFHSEWLRTRPDDYDWNTRTRLESASLTPAVSYIKAQRARALIRREMLDTLEDYDVIVMPTGPVPAPTIEASTGKPGGFYQGKLDLGRRRYTSPAPLAGLPALSVNCGFSEAGLPIGMQIVGKPFAEDLLFKIGHAYEQGTEWRGRHPDL